jgi:hypothetical protein
MSRAAQTVVALGVLCMAAGAGAPGWAAERSWVITTLDSGGDVGKWADLQIDAASTLHILYLRVDNGTLKMISRTGGSWGSPQVVDASGVVAGDCSLAPTGTELPVAYRRTDRDGLWYAGPAEARQWTFETATGSEADDIGQQLTTVWDPDGQPAVACRNYTDGSLVHLRRQPGGAWTLAVVDPGPARGQYCDLAWRPGIGFAFSEYAPDGFLILADRAIEPRTWAVENATTGQADDIGQAMSVVPGPDGQPAIACRNYTDGSLVHLRRSPSGEWTLHQVDPGPSRGTYCDLAWRPGAGFSFSEYAGDLGSLVIADPSLENATWSLETPTGADPDDIGSGLSAVWGPGGELALACRNSTDGSMVHLRRASAGTWETSVVDPGPGGGEYGDLAFRPGAGYAFSEYKSDGGYLGLADRTLHAPRWWMDKTDAALESGHQASCVNGQDGHVDCAYLSRDPVTGVSQVRVIDILPDSTFTICTVADSVASLATDHVYPDLSVSPGPRWQVSYRSAVAESLYYASSEWPGITPAAVPENPENVENPGETTPPASLGDRSRLLGAGPNPSRGTVQISYTAVQGDRAALEVFDAGGRRIRRVEQPCRAGRNAFRFDGLDDRGQRLSSGVYFFSLSIGDRVLGCRKVGMLR